MTFCARAGRYTREVVKGKIPAGKWTKLACQRQIDDLKRWRGKAAPYRFDKAAGERICAFVECLPHIKGEWAKRGESILDVPNGSALVTEAKETHWSES